MKNFDKMHPHFKPMLEHFFQGTRGLRLGPNNFVIEEHHLVLGFLLLPNQTGSPYVPSQLDALQKNGEHIPPERAQVFGVLQRLQSFRRELVDWVTGYYWCLCWSAKWSCRGCSKRTIRLETESSETSKGLRFLCWHRFYGSCKFLQRIWTASVSSDSC